MKRSQLKLGDLFSYDRCNGVYKVIGNYSDLGYNEAALFGESRACSAWDVTLVKTTESGSHPDNVPPQVDMKAGLRGVKAPVGSMSQGALFYNGRGTQYGEDKYVTGNYMRETVPQAGETQELANLYALRDYLDASIRHTTRVRSNIDRFIGGGKGAAATAQEAAYCKDTDGGDIASNLPDLCGSLASLSMGIQKAIDCGLLPADPGVTWDVEKVRAYKNKEKK